MSVSLLTEPAARIRLPLAQVVREVRTPFDYLLWAILLLVGLAGVSYPFWRTYSPWPLHVPEFIAVAGGLFLLIFAKAVGSELRAVRQPGNWLLACSGQSLLLKARSYHNWRGAAEDRVVLDVPARDVDHLQPLGGIQVTGKGKDAQATAVRRIEIHLRDPLPEEVVSAIQVERRRLFGSGWIRSRYNHEPVRVSADGRVLVLDAAGRLRPSYAELLQILTSGYRVLPERSYWEGVPLAGSTSALTDEQARQVALLAASGNRIEAIRQLRELTGLSLREASQALEGDVTQNLKHLLSPRS